MASGWKNIRPVSAARSVGPACRDNPLLRRSASTGAVPVREFRPFGRGGAALRGSRLACRAPRRCAGRHGRQGESDMARARPQHGARTTGIRRGHDTGRWPRRPRSSGSPRRRASPPTDLPAPRLPPIRSPTERRRRGKHGNGETHHEASQAHADRLRTGAGDGHGDSGPGGGRRADRRHRPASGYGGVDGGPGARQSAAGPCVDGALLAPGRLTHRFEKPWTGIRMPHRAALAVPAGAFACYALTVVRTTGQTGGDADTAPSAGPPAKGVGGPVYLHIDIDTGSNISISRIPEPRNRWRSSGLCFPRRSPYRSWCSRN